KLMEILFESISCPAAGFITSQAAAVIGHEILSGAGASPRNNSRGKPTLLVDAGFSATRCLPIVDHVPLVDLSTSTRIAGNEVQRFIDSFLDKHPEWIDHSAADARALESILSLLGTIILKKNDPYDQAVLRNLKAYWSNALNAIEPARKYLLERAIARDVITHNYLHVGNAPDKNSRVAAKGEIPATIKLENVLSFMNRDLTSILFPASSPYMPSIVDCIVDVLSRCPNHLRASLLDNMIVCGGLAVIPGFVDKLHVALKESLDAASSLAMRVVPAVDPIASAWIGGNAIASTPGIKDHLISKQMYMEQDGQLATFLDPAIPRLLH
ncbi:MAG: hypothetical protein Q6370_004045, partial [Candidatus Sigynarchaeota archaeon]